MTLKAVLIGSIGALCETSNLQREAYNQALKEADLDWQWDESTYKQLLKFSGGKERLEMLSNATNGQLNQEQINQIHERKTELACEQVVKQASAREGIHALIKHAKDNGLKLGLVTSTYQPNIDAVIKAAQLSPDDFDVIISRADTKLAKPKPDPYEAALKKLGIEPKEAIAIEDSAASVASAKRAGVTTIATPGDFGQDQDHSQADLILNELGDKDSLQEPVLKLLNS